MSDLTQSRRLRGTGSVLVALLIVGLFGAVVAGVLAFRFAGAAAETARQEAEERARVATETASDLEHELEVLRAEFAQARGDVERLRAERETDRERSAAAIRRLEGELEAAIEREQQVLDRLGLERARLRAEHERLATRWQRATRPMPEGVRLALVKTNELLRADGYPDLRFVRAAEIDAETKEMRDVELLDSDPTTLLSVGHVAARVRLELDRADGSLTVRLFEGSSVENGVSTPHPEDGREIRLSAIDARAWEQRLPFLVTARGIPPPPPGEEQARIPDLDPFEVRAWIGRLQRLLDEAKTERGLRIQEFRALDGGAFLDVTLVGYDRESKLLEFGADARSMRVEIDRVAGTAALNLRGGRLFRSGVDTELPASGYRILLVGVSAERAAELLLGMVGERGGRGVGDEAARRGGG